MAPTPPGTGAWDTDERGRTPHHAHTYPRDGHRRRHDRHRRGRARGRARGPREPGGGGPAGTPDPNSTRGEKAVFFTAELSGAEEVPTADGPAVGDPEGYGRALISIKGDRVTFALEWEGTEAPTLGHVHRGAAGENGAIAVELFTGTLPATVFAISGTAHVDPAVAERINADPHGYYLNLHTGEFPDGAVRGQLF
ncbi:CHRD domain-containing protein [Nocardiopsis sp. N85]|uniref:CHRD domain-containing protein n=1 Tax=Nocardiopsis sp. N85 TaxID=3029400 RepID=UPI00237FA4D3|nr:CHRD domain-containing protein [Nocardiopsis sp. N85]MDE3721996.1 CHRD domain-containing protein [Nocardiopsis sp. N85]